MKQLYRVAIPGLTAADEFVHASSVAQAILLTVRRLLQAKGSIYYDQQRYLWPKFQPLYTRVIDNDMYTVAPEVKPIKALAPASSAPKVQQMTLPFESRLNDRLRQI